MRNSIILLLGLFIVVFFGACEDENDLNPSGADVNRMLDSLDFNRPLVKKYYEDFGVAITHRFDDNMDLKFNFYVKDSKRFWDGLTLGRIKEEKELDEIMTILEKDILCYFKEEVVKDGEVQKNDFVKKYFPTKILLVNQLQSSWGNSNSMMTESVNRVSENLQGNLHGVINGNALALNLNPKVMYATDASALKWKKDIFFIIVSFIVDKFKLDENLPKAFSEYSKDFYGKKVIDLLKEESEDLDDEGNEKTVITKLEATRKYGMIMTSVYPRTGGNIVTTDHILPDRGKDFRLYLDHLLTPEKYVDLKVPTWKITKVTKAKMWYVAHFLMDLGLDIKLLNDDPELWELLDMQEEELDSLTDEKFIEEEQL